MEIKTKFNLGDTLHTVSGSRAVSFEVKNIVIGDGAISYGETTYRTFPEDVCFATRQELCDFIMREE